MKIQCKQIKEDVNLSPRIETGTNSDVVEDYVQCFDQLPPIVVFKVPDDTYYLLVDGWHRLKAAKRLELDEVEADVKYGSLEQAREYALLANLKHGQPLTRKEKRHVIEQFIKLHPERSNSWIASDVGARDVTIESARARLESASQIETLAELLGKDGKKYPRFAVQAADPQDDGTSDKEEESAEPEPEPEPEPAPIPHLGPYELDKVHQADCVDALMSLPESSIDLVFVDPPYNLSKNYGVGSSDKIPDEDYFKWCMQWFLGVFRVLKPGGAFYAMHYPETAARWKQQLDGFLTFQRWITWVYPCNVGHSDSNWSRAQRTILYYVKGKSPAYFDGLADFQPYKNPDDIRVKHTGKPGVTPYDWWEYNLVKNVSDDKTEWPNQIPEDLVWRIIVTSCPESGVVCDAFMGSGTTAVAAIRSGRSWVGFDIESKACKVARERIEKRESG